MSDIFPIQEEPSERAAERSPINIAEARATGTKLAGREQSRQRAKYPFAILGPLAGLIIVIAQAIRGPATGFLYFPDLLLTSLVQLWLMMLLMGSLWDGSGANPGTARWMTDLVLEPNSRLSLIAHHWTRRALWYTGAIIVVGYSLRVPIDILESIVVALALNSLTTAMDLAGALVARGSQMARRWVRVGLVVAVGAALVAWLVACTSKNVLPDHPQAALLLLATAQAWEWFFPARWILNLIESFTNGGPFLLHLLGPFGLAVGTAAGFAHSPPIAPLPSRNPFETAHSASPGENHAH